MSDLSEFRVVRGQAFKAAGVYLCCPVYTKVHPKSKQMTKNYISITTCSTLRMIHLEILPDQSTSAYLQSQRRFIARRGIPKLIVSDNGKTFKGRALKQFNARWRYTSTKWRYNLSQAPWWGGLFERLILSVKRCLIKSVMKIKITFKELTTVTNEVEAGANRQPPTYIYEDEVEEVLTPSHLYCSRRLLDEQHNESSDEDITEINIAENSAKRWRHMNKIVDRFWRKWQKEYLINLRESHKMKTSKKSLKTNVGDAVNIFEEKKRRHWKVGKVLKIIRGKDDVIRGAVVQIFSEKNVKGTISRQLPKLYPLEIIPERDDDEPPPDTNDVEINNTRER